MEIWGELLGFWGPFSSILGHDWDFGVSMRDFGLKSCDFGSHGGDLG